MENQNYIMHEITPLSDRDCFYIADRRKKEFTYPIHCHAEYELNFTENASGVRRVVGDSSEIIGDYDLVLGIATPADAALMMQLGAEGVFVGSGIFKSGNPEKRAAAIVKAVTNFTDAKMLAELSEDLGEAMVGINEQEIELLMAERAVITRLFSLIEAE